MQNHTIITILNENMAAKTNKSQQMKNYVNDLC